MKIAIVYSSPSIVTVLRRVLQTVPDYQVIWAVSSGSQAVTKSAQECPDLMLMELQMQGMDGVETTYQIMKDSPCGILLVADAEQGASKNVSKVYAAMEQGALDTIYLSVNLAQLSEADTSKVAAEILTKVARVRKLLKPLLIQSKIKSATRSPFIDRRGFSSTPPLVAIGSSTGGPKALATILSQLPTNFGAAIAVVQHVDAQFSHGLIDWLNQQSSLPVRSAIIGSHLQKGVVLVATTNDHLYLKPDLTLNYTQDPQDYPYRPSVDVFFKSLAQHWKSPGTAILLTGMGRDGAEGLLALRQKRWHTIAQNQESCVVYGMPKAAVELGGAVAVLPLSAIPIALV